MTAPSDLMRRVCLVTAGLTVLLATACGLFRGPADALGVVVGSMLTLLNFGGLGWAVARATGASRTGALGGRAAWVGASGLRLGLLGTAAGVAVGLDEVGLAGLLVSLTLVPVAVVLAGLVAARAI